MKPFLIITLFALFFSGSCKKEEPELKLPPYTQHGNNIVACKINGQVFISEGKQIASSWSEIGVSFNFFQTDSSIYINASEAEPFDADLFLLFSYPAIQPSPLKDGERSSAILYMPVPNKQLAETKFTTDSVHTGAVEIKYFQNGIIAGTFQFDATDVEGNIVHVTEGRFDLTTD